jgi:hypothetical protein
LPKWCPLSHALGPHVSLSRHIASIIGSDDISQAERALIVFGEINCEFQGVTRGCGCRSSRGCDAAICSTERNTRRLNSSIDNDIGSAFTTTNLGEPILNLLVSD